ncbi:gp58-like family protein [Lactiplantibacillus pentosus]|uniref:gp58-like family protein n=1 Tax=Lactiplantibacillus pentosus TaxID=1589 RepID=UPI0021A5A407|nr:gp58-like family protein [Lactiplantibacillus pentosus]
MIKQSDLALAAWKATERTLDAVVTINKIDYKTTDIAAISYDAGGYTGDTFGIGSNYENSVTIKFSHLIEGLKPGMTVWPKIGIKTSNGYEYSSLGLFIVSDDIQMDRNNDETTIKAYDQMCLLEGTYTSKLTYPAKMTSVIAEIANLAGVLLNTTDISRLPVQVNLPSAITGQTYRNAIGMIAQFYAGFATFDRDGKLTIRTITEPDYTLDPSQYEQGGLTKNEAPYKIGGIQCEVTTTTTDSTGQSTETTNTLQVGATSGSQIKLTNNLMTMDRLASIWQQLQSLTFYPFSLNWFGNPAIEAGDWLTLQDTKGNKFNVPNNGYTMTFDGSLSAVSKADQTSTSSSSYAWRGELSQYVADLGGRQGASGNYIYGTDTTEPPYGAKFNDIWYKQNVNKVELWTYERQADGTGKWVLTVSDATGEEVKAKVDQVELEAKASTDAAKVASDKADQLAAKYDDTNALANQALDRAVGAQSDASSAIATANSTASEFGKVNQKTESALASALNAQNDASSAIAKAESTASEFGKVSQKTESALSSALNAQSDASDAVKQASSAAADSKDAKQIAGAVSQSYKKLTDGSTMTIAELESGLAVKLTKSDLNGYATQTWTQNQIKMTADGINGTMSSIKSTVDSQTTSINDLKADSSSFKSQFTTVNNTLGKQSTDIGTLQATSKELTTGFNTLTSDNNTNKNDISQLKQTATEVSSTLETVQTQVQDSAVGTNLAIGTGQEYSMGFGIPNTVWQDGYAYLKLPLNTTAGEILPQNPHDFWYTLTKGTTYTQTIWFETDAKLINSNGIRFTWFTYAGHDEQPVTLINLGENKYKLYSTYTWPGKSNNNNVRLFDIRSLNSAFDLSTGTYLKFGKLKLEKESLSTDWCTNPADNASVTAFSKLSQTVDGMKSDISKKIEQKDLNGYATQTWTQNQIKVTADGINGTISSIKGTVDSQTTSINDLKADSSSFKSQFTTVNNTLGTHTTDIGALQASSKELSSNFNSLNTDNNTNKNDISQLKQTSKEFSSTLETVQTQIQDSAVGTNLLTGTAKIEFPLNNNSGTQTVEKYDDETNYIQHTSNAAIDHMGPWWPLTPEVGQVYTLSADVCGNGYIQGDQFRYEGGDDSSLSRVDLTNDWKRISNTFRVNRVVGWGNWIIYVNNSTLLKVKHIKIEKGSLATDWCPNPADNATVTAVSKLSQTVDGMQLDISKKIEQKDLNGYATQTWTQNQIKLTSDSLSGTLSSVKSTVDGHATSINDLKADSSSFKSQFTTVNNTLGKQSTDIGTLQASTKSLSASFDSLNTDNNTNKHNISQLQATAGSFSSTLATVQQQVTDSSVGINLLRNARTLDGWKVWAGAGAGKGFNIEDKFSDSGQYRMAHIFNNVDGQNSDGPYWPGVNLFLNAGQVYTISIWAHSLGTSEQPVSWKLWLNWDKDHTYQGVNITNTTAPDWTHYSATFTATVGGQVNNVRIVPYFGTGSAANVGGSVYLLKPKLERGSRATDFSVNPADNATVDAVSSISQTVDAIQTTVRGKVDNDVYQSKVVQLSNQLTSVVGQVNNLGQRNLIYNSELKDNTDGWESNVPLGIGRNQWDHINGSNSLVFSPKGYAVGSWSHAYSKMVPAVQGMKYSASATLFTTGGKLPTATSIAIEIDFFDDSGNRVGFRAIGYDISKGDNYHQFLKVEGAVTPTNATKVCFAIQMNGEGHVVCNHPMMVSDSTVGAYLPDTVGQSEYSQLESNINFKVSKDGVINAINISKEGTSIYGNKLHITADTYIDNAVIKDAMIANLSADKLTAGTINAANINVINLNANNITTGTIKGSNLSINLNTGNVEFQEGRIHNSSNTIDINVNEGYMSVANGSNRVMLKNGEMQFVEPGTYDTSTDPYLRISNTFGGQSTEGAAFIGRKYAVLTNSEDATGNGMFDVGLGTERFSGFATGYGTGLLNKGWHATKVGGANRGVIISGGKEATYRKYATASPSITVGASGSTAGSSRGPNIVMDCNYLYSFSAWVQTSSHAANVYVADDGAIVRASSASKYKTNIERSFDTGMGERILEIPTAHWFDKAEVRKKTLDPQAPDPRRYFGMIADDLDDAGLTELVEYNDKGEVEGLMYDRIALTIIPIVRNYRDRITKLESEIKQLKEG